MERFRIRRMAERLAVKITRNGPQDRFEKELWDLAAIIEEQLLCEMVQLGEAKGRPKKSHEAEKEMESILIQVMHFPSAQKGTKT
jgi:hypothetical protein